LVWKIKPEHGNFVRLADFLVLNFKLLPEHDGARLLALADAAAMLLRLPECQPVGGFVSGAKSAGSLPLSSGEATNARSFTAKGTVMELKPDGRTVVIQHEAISNYMVPAHHPVTEGRMNCAQCHDPHGEDILKPAGGLAMARRNEDCAQCHREQTRPFVFEHPALREGCTACHNPHGSINRMMLTQSDNNLCFRCHTQMPGPGVPPGEIFIGKSPHASYLQVGTCWSAGCHTAVHGSDINPIFLY
jgi:predicted CXXCH cytochrome family protein